MTTEIQIIKELNVIFYKRGWKLLPPDNIYQNDSELTWYKVILSDVYLDRSFIPYKKHLNKFTIEELDNYVVEFINPVCKKYKIDNIHFADEGKNNSIQIK